MIYPYQDPPNFGTSWLIDLGIYSCTDEVKAAPKGCSIRVRSDKKSEPVLNLNPQSNSKCHDSNASPDYFCACQSTQYSCRPTSTRTPTTATGASSETGVVSTTEATTHGGQDANGSADASESTWIVIVTLGLCIYKCFRAEQHQQVREPDVQRALVDVFDRKNEEQCGEKDNEEQNGESEIAIA